MTDTSRGDAEATYARFVGSLGHTLRTPLNGILGFTEMLLAEAGGPLTERQRTYLNHVQDAGRRQLELINNLVDLARFDAQWSERAPAPHDVGRLVRAATAEAEAAATAGEITLDVTVDRGLDPVTVDQDELIRVVGILLSNAIRATEAGGSVAVTVDALTEGDTAWCRIAVCDTGSGIPLEEQAALFADYRDETAVQARRDRRSGTGLALAQRIVESYGGRMAMESAGEPGQGARFTVELPAGTKAGAGAGAGA